MRKRLKIRFNGTVALLVGMFFYGAAGCGRPVASSTDLEGDSRDVFPSDCGEPAGSEGMPVRFVNVASNVIPEGSIVAMVSSGQPQFYQFWVLDTRCSPTYLCGIIWHPSSSGFQCEYQGGPAQPCSDFTGSWIGLTGVDGEKSESLPVVVSWRGATPTGADADFLLRYSDSVDGCATAFHQATIHFHASAQ